MIKRVLQIMVNEGIADKRTIASRLGIHVETLDDMLQIMLDHGYLRLGECGSSDEACCTSCPMSTGCHPQDIVGQTYYITERGKKYALR